MFQILPLRLSPRQHKSRIILRTRFLGGWVSRATCVVCCVSIGAFVLNRTDFNLDVVGLAMEAFDKSTLRQLVPFHPTKRRDKSDRSIEIEYVATAYSVSGRTTSGRMVRRGVIAADPRVLPLGTRVRLEAGDYSGEYLVSETKSDLSVGITKRIGIWTPSEAEAKQFGERPISLTVLSYGTNRSPVALRESLESKRREHKLAVALFKKALALWEKRTSREVKKSAEYYEKRPDLYDSARFNPIKFGPDDPNAKTFLDTYYERIRLQMDRQRGLISQSEHDERLVKIVAEEREIADSRKYSSSEVARYHENVAKVQATLGSLQNRNWDTALKFGMVLVALLGIALPFYLGYNKDRREKSTLALEKRKLELAEEGASFQVAEMRLKIAQLEKQLRLSEKHLVVP